MDDKSEVKEVRCLIYLPLGASAYISVAKVTAKMFACQVCYTTSHCVGLAYQLYDILSQNRDENMSVPP